MEAGALLAYLAEGKMHW